MSNDFKSQFHDKLINKTIDADSGGKIGKSILESKIKGLSIVKTDSKGKEVSFDIIPWDQKLEGGVVVKGNPFFAFNFFESLNSPVMTGSLYLRDHMNWGDEFTLNGTEKIILTCVESIATKAQSSSETPDRPIQEQCIRNDKTFSNVQRGGRNIHHHPRRRHCRQSSLQKNNNRPIVVPLPPL